MSRGESWTHTAFLHHKAWRVRLTSFSDVVCQYWKWMLQKVGPKLPEYDLMTKEMTGILPIMHQMANQLPCQVLFKILHSTNMHLFFIHYRISGICDGQKGSDQLEERNTNKSFKNFIFMLMFSSTCQKYVRELNVFLCFSNSEKT